MPTLYDGDHLLEDFALIRREWGVRDERRINQFLDEIGGNEDALWEMTRRKQIREFERPYFNSCAIGWMLEEKYSMYRIRPIRPWSDYRMLYGYDFNRDHLYVLAVVRKMAHTDPNYDITRYYDYEHHHRISARVLAEYDELGLPRIAS